MFRGINCVFRRLKTMTGKFEFRLCSNGYNYLWKDGELFVTEKGDYILLEQDKDDITDLINGLSEENQKLNKNRNSTIQYIDAIIQANECEIRWATDNNADCSFAKYVNEELEKIKKRINND